MRILEQDNTLKTVNIKTEFSKKLGFIKRYSSFTSEQIILLQLLFNLFGNFNFVKITCY